ncbi:MAG: hypothetical protein AB7Q01_07245 [Gammaproteobacteria bacterium]
MRFLVAENGVCRHSAPFSFRSRPTIRRCIGIEEEPNGETLRHGVAFSFEPSQTLPTVDPLIPKVRLFNDHVQMYPDTFGDMRMWHWFRDERSSDYAASAIMPEIVTRRGFVFLGKRQPADRLDYEAVLDDFDRVLPLYIYVESGGDERKAEARAANGAFSFRPGFVDKPPSTTASIAERELNITLKHNLMQAALYRRLATRYGADNVSTEQPSSLGTKIDVVLREDVDTYTYYEIKTALLPRACIREALGQVLEYGYWPGSHEPKQLIICGETALDDDGEEYLALLSERFCLPIAYERIVLDA